MTSRRGLSLLALAALVVTVAVVVGSLLQGGILDPQHKQPLPGPDVTPLPVAVAASLPPTAVRLLAAGDIAQCGSRGAESTAALLATMPEAIVLPLGDLAYPDGREQDFADCYDPTWGIARDRSWPVPGNHEYHTTGAAGYFAYWGAAAGTPETPYRAMELNGWRVYLLSSECGQNNDVCTMESQLGWLQADLDAHPAACILAAFHRPRFSSGPHGSNTSVDGLWRALAGAGADVVLAGHDHLYERFAPLDADGQPAQGGVRAWVVGTGGAQLYRFNDPLPGSEVRADESFGVLELVLRTDGYDWGFHATLGTPFEDVGSSTC